MADGRIVSADEVRREVPEIAALLEDAPERGFVEMPALADLGERLELDALELARRLDLRPAEVSAIEREALDELALRREIAVAA